MEIVVAAELQNELGYLVDTGLALAQQLYDFSETLGSTGDSLRWLAIDVSLFSSVLAQVTSTIANAKAVDVSQSAVRTARDITQRCQAIFEKTSVAIKVARSGESHLQMVRRVKWWFRKSKVALLTEQLSTCSATLYLMLVTMQFAQRLSDRGDQPSDTLEDEKHHSLTYNLFRAQQSSNERLSQLERQFEHEAEDVEALYRREYRNSMPPPYSPPRSDGQQRLGTAIDERLIHGNVSYDVRLSRMIQDHVDRLSIVSISNIDDISALTLKQIAFLQTNQLLREWFNQPVAEAELLQVTSNSTSPGVTWLESCEDPPSFCHLKSYEQRNTEMLRDVPLGGSAGNQKSDQDHSLFKTFRVGISDPCWKVLPIALRKYGINADPSMYMLYIVWGDLERRILPDEAPLAVFKDLDKQGMKPLFMLRKVVQQAATTEEKEEVADDGTWI